MISKRDLLKRIEKLEKQGEPTLSVFVVDEDGERVKNRYYGMGGLYCKTKEIRFTEVCNALQDMCDIEITYQEIEGKSGVVIYEKG